MDNSPGQFGTVLGADGSPKLSEGDDPDSARFSARLSEVELAAWLEIRPSVRRAQVASDRDQEVTAIGEGGWCGVLDAAVGCPR
jgi:hypothetical protein